VFAVATFESIGPLGGVAETVAVRSSSPVSIRRQALAEEDLVPVRVEDARRAFAPLHVLWLAGNLAPALAELLELGIDVVAVEPERDAAGRVDRLRDREAELEPAEPEGRELVFPAVALLEAEPVAVEGDCALEVGGVENRERLAEGQARILVQSG